MVAVEIDHDLWNLFLSLRKCEEFSEYFSPKLKSDVVSISC